MEHTHTYSLSELCQQVTETLEYAFQNNCWVKAEIGSLQEKGGHCYIELIEKSNSGSLLAAKIRANCWANTYSMLSAFFRHEVGEPLRSGMQVLLEGNIHFHPVYGISFQIIGIDPTYTVGAVAKQRQLTIERLQAEGVFDMNKQLTLPSLLKQIAVISAPEAAGYGDFCDQLHNNTFHFQFFTQLFPAIMQGDRAGLSIINALSEIFRQEQHFQAVVIIRGGGANSDLHCFDSYELAACCAQFPLPVIAGIGHQRDVSIVDMVVHTSVKTPTAAAEFLINQRLLQQERLTTLANRLSTACRQRVIQDKHVLEKKRLQLSVVFNNSIRKEQNKLTLIEQTIALHSPEKIYRMGYTLTKCNGNILRNATDIQSGDRLITEFHDGTVTSIAQ
ncbi:MAG: exodeoxyribonuclease VII large subunit [Paludibacter sp.]|nr:exodeoxyribonuclease VII large subunit [Bacteroidales bacterium]MCM1068451.1 exodeoxyribonuclease VII large subunit [Prevotella sp.]MCM1353405.1 exodeoxyribonuclease VII large subunit [Bacteroides sp.]MCM1442566.1 exodeoxyribonuclease VII large subunit [Muribaculum sp.]MCM1481411.1 exodeoxyribonuclease VII large subunit [Paludibacter sp.]